jgi:type I restriction enzyme S subunit
MAPYLSLVDQKRLRILLPSIEEQRAIAHILGTLDDKIELNRRTSETLEAMARALFKSWFVDFDPVRAKMEGREPGLPKSLVDLFPARLVDSELGEIPEGWVVVTLGEMVETVKGCSYRSEELVESDTALVTLKSFARGGGYRPDGLKSFAGPYKAVQVVNPGEVVIACTDVTQAAEVIGRPAIVGVTSSYRRLVASLDTLIVRPRNQRVTPAFFYLLGGTEAFVSHTYAHTTGTTVLHLAKDAVPSFTFACPSEQLVHRFDAMAAPALARVRSLGEESDALALLRDALLPKLISGEVRTSDVSKSLDVTV